VVTTVIVTFVTDTTIVLMTVVADTI